MNHNRNRFCLSWLWFKWIFVFVVRNRTKGKKLIWTSVKPAEVTGKNSRVDGVNSAPDKSGTPDFMLLMSLLSIDVKKTF